MDKEILKKILLSLKKEDFFAKADLHIHSNESDGKINPVQIVEQAKSLEKKFISICDHNTVEAYLSTNILAENIVIPAIEFDCYFKGVLIHILGYGIDIDNKEIKNLYAASKLGRRFNLYRIFKLRNAKEVIEKIKNANGIPVLAHPACYWCFNLDDFIKSLIDIGLEGIETYYPYIGLRRIVKFHSKNTVENIADKYNLIKTGGSDFHGKKLK